MATTRNNINIACSNFINRRNPVSSPWSRFCPLRSSFPCRSKQAYRHQPLLLPPCYHRFYTGISLHNVLQPYCTPCSLRYSPIPQWHYFGMMDVPLLCSQSVFADNCRGIPEIYFRVGPGNFNAFSIECVFQPKSQFTHNSPLLRRLGISQDFNVYA